MEPTLHCARPEPYCEAGSSDRVLANRFIYHFHSPRRGDIVVFHAPNAARRECVGGIFVKAWQYWSVYRRSKAILDEVLAAPDRWTYTDLAIRPPEADELETRKEEMMAEMEATA